MYKKCSKCKEEKDIEYFHKRTQSKDGYRNVCKLCMPKYEYDKPINDGPKKCITCKVIKPFEEFYKTHKLICKDCQYKRQFKYKTTLNGSLTGLLNAAKNRSKILKNERAEFDLTLDDLKDIYERQNGLCYYSTIQMKFEGEFKMSLERLDNDMGYIKTNVVLCCTEFNCASKWSFDKILEMLEFLDLNIKENYIDFGDVHSNSKKKYYESPRCKLKTLCTSAKHRVAKKEKIGRHLEYDIDFEFLVELYNKQKGLCAYSGMPMQFGNYKTTDWVISLERIDVTIGYVKDNVCFICIEFNSTDHSIRIKNKSDTSTGWSKEKFEYFVKTFRENIKTI